MILDAGFTQGYDEPDITKTDGSSLTGGEIQIKFTFSYSGTANGSEVLEIDRAAASSIYDFYGNNLDQSGEPTTFNTVNLNIL